MAVCANAAMQEYKERNGVVNLDIYLVKMDEELVCVSASYIFITETKLQGTVCTMFIPCLEGV